MRRAILVLTAAAILLATVVSFTVQSDPNAVGAAGTGGTIAVPASVGPSGGYTSLVLDSAGNPVVAFFDGGNDDLRVLHCGNSTCTAGNTVVSPDTSECVGTWPSIALDSSGWPVVSYQQCNFGYVKILRCGNPACSSGNSIVTADSSGQVGFQTSIALDASDRPIVSYYDNAAGDLKVLRCGNTICSSGNSITSPDTVGTIGTYSAIALDASDHPIVSYVDDTNARIKVLSCGDATCSSGNTIATPDVASFVDRATDIALDVSGEPVVSYFDLSSDDIKVLDCGNLSCTSGNSIATIDTSLVGPHQSFALNADGSVTLTYNEGNLVVLRCTTTACVGAIRSVPDVSGSTGWVSIALDSNDNPVVSYVGFPNELRVLHCGVPECGSKPTPTPTITDTPGPTATPTPTQTPTITPTPCPTQGCPTATPTVTPRPDTDVDGCTDIEELGPDEESGGRRNPANPWDFYDVHPLGGNGVIDLFGDIFGVAYLFGYETGDPGYDPSFDRSAPPTEAEEPDPSKREPWDMGAPDGTIDLFIDIFGVAYQFGHACEGP